MLCKITYALTADGRVLHISEAERGMNCDCLCPGCGEKLIARKGSELGHHFAHSSGVDCKSGYDASLCYAFLRGITELGWIQLPAYIRNRSIVDDGSGFHILAPAAKVKISKVELTRKAGIGITGLIAYCGEKPMRIRILTAYTISKTNFANVKAAGLPVLEIDLSREDVINNEIIRGMLTSPPSNVHWVYNKRAEDIWEAMLAKCERLKLEGADNAIYTLGCPIPSKRTDGFRCYAKTSCAYCEYFFGLGGAGDERHILCGRRNVITEPADLLLDLAQRKNKYKIRF